MALLKSLMIAGASAVGVAIALPTLANTTAPMVTDTLMAGTAYEAAETMMDDMAEPTMMDEATEPMMGQPTIVDIAASSESFQTLTAALEAADLVSTLQGEGPFTVFAPTDEAFAALPPGTLEALLLPENKDILVSILTYHVVPGSVMSTDLTSGAVPTAEGRSIMVDVSEAGVMVNNASVVMADIEASNGVVHVIDQVILPPDM
ncbi:fasciclin domain-containing protein [Leptolyngbya sp. CCY15150]|uniref:fasciclin domain-containing protein n=1 Tax=Leptolyngbya sp. CCY15150 TaxID=2767772 RepID=UPI0031BB3BEE